MKNLLIFIIEGRSLPEKKEPIKKVRINYPESKKDKKWHQ
jgi:hypothetical protein